MRFVLLSTFISLAWTQDEAAAGGDGPGLEGLMGGLGGGGADGKGGMPDMSKLMGGLGGGGGGAGGMPDMASMMGGMGGMGDMMGGGGGGGGALPPDPFPPVKSDVKFIACSTCKLMAKRLHREMSKWDSKVTKSEEAMQKKVAQMCEGPSSGSDAGSWITEYDMVESKDGKAIELKRQSAPGACEVECKTIAEACKAVVQESEIELAAALYKSFNGKAKKAFDVKALTSRLCTSDDAWAANMEGGCAAGVPKVPKKRKAGPAFQPKTQSPPVKDPEAEAHEPKTQSPPTLPIETSKPGTLPKKILKDPEAEAEAEL